LAAAAFGPYDTHELVYAEELFAQIPDESLVILDRGFFSAAVFFSLCASGKSSKTALFDSKALLVV